MESKTGALLTKISAIINFVVAGIIFLIGIVALIGLNMYQGIPFNLVFLMLAFTLIVLVVGLLLWNAAEKMKNKKTVKKGAIWAIVLGVLTIQVISGILALVGGIIAIIDADKKK